MRENYVNIGRRKQARRALTGRVLILVLSAVIIFALSLMLGNYLKAQVAALPPRGDMPDTLLSGQLPADTSDASAVSIMASNLPLTELTSTRAVDAMVEELTLGSREAVSLYLRDAAGEVHFRSTVAEQLTGQPAAGIDLATLVPSLSEAGIYTSAVLAVTSFGEGDRVAGELQRAFELSLSAEVSASGVDEILLVGLPVSVDTLDAVTAYLADVAAQLNEGVQLAVAMPPELMEGAAGTVLAKQLSQCADTLALDLRTISQEDGQFVALVGDILSDASLYFSKYNMRLLLPAVNDATFSELRQLFEVNAVRNWQVVE